MKDKRYFGFIEMIGSVVMLKIDPARNNSKKYLSEKYYKLNRTVGIITIVILILLLLWIELAVGIFGSPIGGS